MKSRKKLDMISNHFVMAFGFKQRNNQCYDTFPHLIIVSDG